MAHAIVDAELADPLPRVDLADDEDGIALLLRMHGRPVYYGLHALEPGTRCDGEGLWALARAEAAARSVAAQRPRRARPARGAGPGRRDRRSSARVTARTCSPPACAASARRRRRRRRRGARGRQRPARRRDGGARGRARACATRASRGRTGLRAQPRPARGDRGVRRVPRRRHGRRPRLASAGSTSRWREPGRGRRHRPRPPGRAANRGAGRLRAARRVPSRGAEAALRGPALPGNRALPGRRRDRSAPAATWSCGASWCSSSAASTRRWTPAAAAGRRRPRHLPADRPRPARRSSTSRACSSSTATGASTRRSGGSTGRGARASWPSSPRPTAPIAERAPGPRDAALVARVRARNVVVKSLLRRQAGDAGPRARRAGRRARRATTGSYARSRRRSEAIRRAA